MRRWLVASVFVLIPLSGRAQMPIPDESPPDAATLFTHQCATCHTLDATEEPRQGPTLAHVFGRNIGSVAGYEYTPGYRKAGQDGQVWDAARLDKYLQDPQAMFPGSTMAYRQPKAAIRKQVIGYLKEKG